MKSISKKILAGTIAASLLAGGYGLLHNQAFADTSGTSADQNASSASSSNHHTGFGDHSKRHEGFRGSIIQETATILGVDQSAVTDALKQGKTLAQIAQEKGLSEDDFLQKVTAAETKAIDDALTAGKITQDQADKQKSGLSDRLKQMIENTKPEGDFHGKGHDGFGPWENYEAVSQILGMTEQELKTEVQAGKSLAEVAQEKGISEDQLISKLKDSMTDRLKQFVENKRQPKAPASSAPSADSSTPSA
jgi:uncharacterized protein YidB (DUF937 family)